MKTWIMLGCLVVGLGLVGGTPAEAVPYSLLVNSSEVLQYNVCRGCSGVVQANYADITQIINAATYGGAAGPSAQLNLSSIRQINLCIRCIDVTQFNFASVFQVNDSVYTRGGIQVNFSDIHQINRCIHCSYVTQSNEAVVEQIINGRGGYRFNISHIDQLNQIRGGHGISPVPEPATLFLLGAGLMGLGAARFKRAAIERTRD